MPRNGLTGFLGCCNSSSLDISEVSSYAVSNLHKFQAPEHLTGDEPKYAHCRDSDWAPRPVRFPRRKADVMAKGQVVIQGLCNEHIG